MDVAKGGKTRIEQWWEENGLAPDELEKILDGDQNLDKWREANPDKFLDLAGADLDGFPLKEAKLCLAVLKDANLQGGRLSNVDLRGADLKAARLQGAMLNGAKLQGTDLRGANIERAQLGGASFDGADLRGIVGAFGPSRADFFAGDSGDQEHAKYKTHWFSISWNLLALVRQFRMFGISYSGMVGIVFYAAAAQWANTTIRAARDVATSAEKSQAVKRIAKEAEEIQSGGGQAVRDRWVEIVEHVLKNLAEIPVPCYLAVQLFMLFLMAVGATIYHLGCPDLVKENTPTEWYRGPEGRSCVEYRSAMWSRAFLRYFCFILVISSGLYTICHLLYRAKLALVFLWA